MVGAVDQQGFDVDGCIRVMVHRPC
jgi:hypothetical protein